MKNREKYPNTEDALKAFEEHNKHGNCGATFEEWLDHDPEEVPVGLKFAAVGLALLSRMAKDTEKTAERKPESTGDEKKPDEAGDIECPICHGKNAKIDKFLSPHFTCPDCGSYIGATASLVEKEPYLIYDAKAFKSFIADLCTKNNAK